MTVVGSRKMIVYDDVSAEGKVRVYDKGAFRKGDVTYGDFQYKLHSGDILIPRLDMREPLQEECAHFIECIRSGTATAHRRRERSARAASAGGQPAEPGKRRRQGCWRV
jgi:predicted dehydrogenase